MPEPFQRHAGNDSLIGRALGRVTSASLIREIEDALARAPRVRDVTAAQIAEIAARRGVVLASRQRTARRSLYRRFLEHCLLDQAVSEEEAAELAHLRALLALSDEDAARTHDDVVHAVYGAALDGVLRDHRLDPEEAEFLGRLSRDLAIAPEQAERMKAEAELRARRRFLDMTSVRDDGIAIGPGLTLELHGASETSIEDAVARALDEATRAFPGIERAEVSAIAADLAGGRVARWRVTVKAHRQPA